MNDNNQQCVNILSIGGIDSRSGGGIMSDYHIFRKLHTFPFTVSTSIVSVEDVDISIHPLPIEIIREQLKTIEHLEFNAIKVGFLPNIETIEVVSEFIGHKKSNARILVDPVISFKESADTNDLGTDAYDYLKALVKLISYADIITPNLDEWEILSSNADFKQIFENQKSLAIVIKDIDPHHDMAVDRIYPQYNISEEFFDMKLERIKSSTIFGAGCTLSAIITALIGQRLPKNNADITTLSSDKTNILQEIVQEAKVKTHLSIRNGKNICANQELLGGPVGDIE